MLNSSPSGFFSLLGIGQYLIRASLPVFKPEGYQSGPVDYFVRFTHKLAKILNAENLLRTVSESALKSLDHSLIPGIAFEKDTSFINPKSASGLKTLEAKFKEWESRFPKTIKIAVFGHSDLGEKDAKDLSERRALSAFAFITNDAAAWETLYTKEKWGLKPLQILLKDLGHYNGNPDGADGPKTQAAFKALQKKSGLAESGKEDAATRKALFSAYMKGKHDIQIDASKFCKVAGNPWMGCACNNRIKHGESTAPENRRVVFILLNPSKYFPVYFPCQDGNEAGCVAQCKRPGKRSAAGIKCPIYDELVRESEQLPAKGSDREDKVPDPVARKPIGSYDIEKAVAHVNANAYEASQGKCATFVRQAIQAGGGVISLPYPFYGKDYGPPLIELGFAKIDTENFIPMKGDLAVFQPPTDKKEGHIQMFNGELWVSDFFQRGPDIYPGKKYRSEKVSYEIFRP